MTDGQRIAELERENKYLKTRLSFFEAEMRRPGIVECNYDTKNVTLRLNEYQTSNLVWLLRKTQPTHQTGDWHGEILYALEPTMNGFFTYRPNVND